MNLLHLRYAVEVAKTGSITQAADNLYMGQPNLSRAVRELEESIGFPIFLRSPKGMTPTSKGEEFLRQARSILSQIDELETRFSPGAGDAQQLRVCVPSASYCLEAFARFLGSVCLSPGSQVTYQQTGPLQTLRGVAEQSYSLGLLRVPPRREAYFLELLGEEELSWEPFWEFQQQATLSAGHPLASSGGPLTWEALEQSGPELLCPEEGSITPPLPPEQRALLCSPDALLDLLSLLPGAFCRDSPAPEEFLRRRGLVQRCCSPPGEPWRDLLIYPQHSRPTLWEEQFLSSLRRVRDTLSPAP